MTKDEKSLLHFMVRSRTIKIEVRSEVGTEGDSVDEVIVEFMDGNEQAAAGTAGAKVLRVKKEGGQISS
jgi:hypothetical protein